MNSKGVSHATEWLPSRQHVTGRKGFWRDNVFGLGVLMENKGKILYHNTGKRNRQIWCARIRGVSHVTLLLGNARNAAVMAAVTRQHEWRCSS
jgi:hypothetical protein